MSRIQFAAMSLLAVSLVSCKQQGTPAAAEAQGPAKAPAAATPAVSSTGQVTWVTVRDAREQAFSIQVPQGWKTYGGVFRFSSVDVRLVVDMTSPDGMTNLRVGDATVPPYRVPGPFLAAGAGVAAYASGQVFATKYGQARFASMCQGVQLTKSDAVAPKYHAAGSGLVRTTAGEAFFTCTKNGTAMGAYVYAETTLVGPGGPGSNWTVSALGSLIAPSAQATAAGTLLAHAGQTLTMNPAWTAMQQQLTNQAIQQINASTQATIAATQQENAREQGMISAMSNDSFNDVINGVQETQDTTTGQTYVTPLGQGGTQWINGNNTVVESGLSPGAGFDQLQPTGR